MSLSDIDIQTKHMTHANTYAMYSVVDHRYIFMRLDESMHSFSIGVMIDKDPGLSQQCVPKLCRKHLLDIVVAGVLADVQELVVVDALGFLQLCLGVPQHAGDALHL